MVYDIISARVADVHAELKKLLSHLDEFPSPTAVAENRGSDVGVARAFTNDLGKVTLRAADATEAMIEELAKTDSTIRAALKDLTAHDEELADSAERFENFLDSAAEHSSPPPPPPPASAPAPDNPGSTGAGFGDY